MRKPIAALKRPRPGWQLIASQDTQESAHEIVGFRAIRILVDSTTFMTTETVFKIFLGRCGRMGHFECLTQKINAYNCNEMERDGERQVRKGWCMRVLIPL